jgi:hypothetical protein
VKDISVVEAIATPMITEVKPSHDRSVGVPPTMIIVKKAVNKGSAALTVCVKAMLTSEIDMFAQRMPNQFKTDNGKRIVSFSALTFGKPCHCNAQATRQQKEQVPKFTEVIRTGFGYALSSLLLSTL